MIRELKLPDVGEGIAEGEIVRWHVEPGDAVEEDQLLAEVETDKAVVDLPSPVVGTVTERHAEEGDIVEVGSVIVTFEVENEADAGTVSEEATESPAASETQQDNAEVATPSGAPDENGDSTAGAATSVEESEDGAVDPSHVFAPPRVRRLARELGVELSELAARVDGRIEASDVRRAAGEIEEPAAVNEESAGSGAEAADTVQSADSEPKPTAASEPSKPQSRRSDSPARAATQETADREKTLAAPATRQLAREMGVDIDAVPASEEREGTPFVTPADVEAFASGETATEQPPAPAFEPRTATGERTETRVEYRGIRKVIGDNMEQAKYNAPHVTHHDSTEIDDLVEARTTFKEHVDEELSITYLPFVIKAVVKALQEHPYMNSSLDKESGEIVLKEYYDIGIATASERGLVVPVIEDADKKGIRELAQEIDYLVTRARNGDLTPDEMRGSTFTITNFGAIGGDHATPIINYPEAAILGLGAIKERPVAVDGDVHARHTLPLSLSVDHRLIDGAVAAQFTNDVKTYLSTPEMLLL